MTILNMAGHALIERGGTYLVTHRSAANDYMPLMWDLPGGTIELGETLEAGVVREVLEETTLHITLQKPEYIFTNLGSYPKRQVFQAIYSSRYLSGEVTLNPEEHDEHAWVTLEEMAKLNTIAFLKSFFEYKSKNALK